MNKLENKVAVVTGGNSGIGYATAKELKNEGAQVIITGRRADALASAAETLGVSSIVADQSSLTATEQLVQEVKEKYGQVDILFINAGIVNQSSIENATEKHFDEIMDINFKGAFFTLSRFIPILKEGASVVFLSSNTASMSYPNSSVYSASKSALNSLMKIAAVELAPRKIRVNSISPGPTETEIMNKTGLDEETLKAVKGHLIEKIPLKRIGTAADVAKLVVYFSGDAAGFITGSEVLIDGGMVLA